MIASFERIPFRLIPNTGMPFPTVQQESLHVDKIPAFCWGLWFKGSGNRAFTQPFLSKGSPAKHACHWRASALHKSQSRSAVGARPQTPGGTSMTPKLWEEPIFQGSWRLQGLILGFRLAETDRSRAWDHLPNDWSGRTSRSLSTQLLLVDLSDELNARIRLRTTVAVYDLPPVLKERFGLSPTHFVEDPCPYCANTRMT